MSDLKRKYVEEIRPMLQQHGEYSSPMQIQKIEKIVLNMRVGEAVHDKKHLIHAEKALGLIAGQKPVVCLARKSVAGFKIRKGFPIGCRVTLRRERMWNFLEKLLKIVLPRIRDFRGLNRNSFDGSGNFSFGITEFIVFPEIDMESIDKMRGFDISIVTTARKDEDAKQLLIALGFPFQK